MKFILCQPAIFRFKWELDVCLTNLTKLGYTDFVLLFTQGYSDIPKYFKDKYNCSVHVYPDERTDYSYQPSVKPYLWWRYLDEFPEAEKGTYVYIDADVILREPLDMSKLPATPEQWFASDCGHYLNYDYIKQCTNGQLCLDMLAEVIGVSEEQFKSINSRTGGAQWVIVNPSAEYWKKVYEDTITTFNYFRPMSTNIQKWTAEMWAQVYNMLYFGIDVQVSSELDFCWATDPIDKWYDVKIYHNAGVDYLMTDLFYKGQYTEEWKSPFDEDLSFVNQGKCSSKYVEAIKEVKMITNG